MPRRRFPRVRHYARGLDHLGVFVALLFFDASLTPSPLPRPWVFQGLVTGIAAAVGYGLGVAVAWILRHSGLRPPSRRIRRASWLALGVFAAVAVPIILWLGASGQQDIRRALDAPAGSRDLHIGVFTIAVATATRAPGSPERRPVYGDGQTVRFAATTADLQEPDGTRSHPRIVYLQHASDPVLWWSTDLIWRKPDWLTEPRGPDVTPAVRWYPFVTFWQLTRDMAVGLNAPAGYGHHYGSEITAAWIAILRPPGWTQADTAALDAVPVV